MIIFTVFQFCQESEAIPLLADTTVSTPDSSIEQSDSATLSVRSDLNGVRVLLDSVLLGITPIEPIGITHGKHILRFVHPEDNIWLHPAIVETIQINPSDNIERIVSFPSLYHIISEPYGATIILNDSIVGTTPLRLVLEGEMHMIKFTMDGYAEAIVPLPSGGGIVNQKMKSLRDKDNNGLSLFLADHQSQNYLPHYIATGTAVAAGSAAAYFKIKADKYYKEYRRTGDNATLNRIERLDLASGISLAVCEISLIIVSYLLFSQ